MTTDIEIKQAEKHAAIRFQNVDKLFPGVKALNDVSFDVQDGHIHCIIGENGAGKSTLIKILAGVNAPDKGIIELFGKPVHFKSPEDAKNAGIAVVYQELSNFLHLDVARNLFCNNLPVSGGRISYRGLYRQARKVLDDCGLHYIDERTPMRELSLGSQQMVEIAGLISEKARIVILDEPTSALTEVEVEKLFDLIAQMKEQGMTVIYISHRLDEVLELADTITVLKDGEHVITMPRTEDTSKQQLVRYMVGRDVLFYFRDNVKEPGAVFMEVEDLNAGPLVRDVSFTLRQGEILGISGLEGSGRTELLEALFGFRTKTSGTVRVNGKPVHISSPIDAKWNGLSYITKERKNQGLFLNLDVVTNIAAASQKKHHPSGLINYGKSADLARDYVKRMNIRCSGINQRTLNLSGGNQQKVLLSMWLANEPNILLIDEPTRGVDVGAKAEIHALLRSIVETGKGVIFVSSELPELLASCDRIAVMHEGVVMDILDNDSSISEEQIMQLASGMEAEKPA